MPLESFDLCTIFKFNVLVAFPAFTKCEHQTAEAAQSGAGWEGGRRASGSTPSWGPKIGMRAGSRMFSLTFSECCRGALEHSNASPLTIACGYCTLMYNV